MSRHPAEPPADWLPSPDEGTARPAPGEPLPRRQVPPQPQPGHPGPAAWYPPPDGPPGNGNGTGAHQHPPGHPPMPDYPPAPGYPPAPAHPPEPGYPPYPGPPRTTGPGGLPPNGHGPPVPAAGPVTATGPAIAHDEYGPDHEAYGLLPDDGVDRHGLAPGEYGVVYDDHDLSREAEPDADDLPEPGAAGPDSAEALRSAGSAARWAMLGYLTVPLFGFVVPLLVYLRARRRDSWARAHAAQALNAWITVLLYDVSALIMGTTLALDTPQVALIVFAPLVVALWLVMLILLVRAATAASRGREYAFPRWLCSPIVR